MIRIKKISISLILTFSLVTQAAFPIVALAEDVATPTDTNTTDQTQQPEAPAPTDTSSLSGSEQDQTSASESSSSSSSSSESDSSTTQSSTQEQHDNLSIEATNMDLGDVASTTEEAASTTEKVASTTQELVNSSGSSVQENVSDAASSTASGFVDPVLIDPASTTDDLLDLGGGALGGDQPAFDASTTHPRIQTGSAVVLANILNLLNVSFINSDGGIVFSNFTDQAPTIDLRDLSLLTGLCDDNGCSQQGMMLNLIADASINNDLVLDAMSGHNFASGGTTTAIDSGDAFAGLNLINIANTNFVNAKYLLLTFNAFRGVNGDIVFPSLLDYFQNSGTGLTGDSSIVNTASVNNDVSVGADSGSNTTSGSDNSFIETGNSDAHANVFNQINSLLQNTSISILFRISGKWTGDVYGLPEGVSQVRAPDGSVYIFGSPNDSGDYGPPVTLNSTSTTDINNRVQVAALSGQNAIDDASTALISTGNALASANIVNIANQNVIGRNWILAIINIFGDFNGNIAFGRPDLWVGDQVETPNTVQNGSELTYKITVINNGDSPASHVIVTETPDFSHVELLDASMAFGTSTPGALQFDVGTLDPGAAVEITYHARIHSSDQGQDIVNTTNAASLETDNNLEDNTDSATVRTTIFGGGGGSGSIFSTSNVGGGGGNMDWTPDMVTVERLTKNVEADENNPSVEEKVVIHNTTNNPIENVTFTDNLINSRGQFVHSEVWSLDTIAPHEEITIQYKLLFDKSSEPGLYSLTTELEGKKFPLTIFANGSITLHMPLPPLIPDTGKIAPVKVIDRGVTDMPHLVATTTQPLALTAAAAASDGGYSDMFIYFVLFVLLMIGSYGALRALTYVRDEKEEPISA